ncbi:unnamed protein product [Bursaphelenchus okinawaensis]|uniref:EF-hand domain-containing protein n=1 Tax=Bursaphelenchus okinawaensis TaxID=465554 RepID=A0A811KN01_9BILA|nr:unnamed protein product [Bursaphelenchus okinawaensis]CAG9105949.1 unnamed protein product [Bursaphelenchus okinawaensis]
MKAIAVGLIVLLGVSAQLPPSENAIDFDSLDSNKDNQISFAEFSKWYSANKESKPEAELRRLFQNYDTDNDSHLHIQEFVPLAYQLSRTPKKEVDNLFSHLDTDKNGILTRAELKNSKENLGPEIIEGLFLVADTNGDGQITHQEFGTIQGAFGQTPSSRKSENVGIARALIDNMDTNKDKKLSPQEVHTFVSQFNKVSPKTVATAFARLDSNHDGQLTLAELEVLPQTITDLAGFKQPKTW